MTNNRFGGMLGLCQKAGKVSSGEFSCEKALKSGNAKLCIVAEGASENTLKHFKDMCSYRKVPIILGFIGSDELGHIIGKKDRVVVTVNDAGFAAGLQKIVEGGK